MVRREGDAMTQINLTLPAMHCDGCIRAITAVARRLDPDATVSTELATHAARFSGQLDEPALRAALTRAGFPPGLAAPGVAD